MNRVKRGCVARTRRDTWQTVVKGARGARSKQTRTIRQQAMKSLSYSSRDRLTRKRQFRRLWITRINAAAKIQETRYSKFINHIQQDGQVWNRKLLSQWSVLAHTPFNGLIVRLHRKYTHPEQGREDSFS